MSDISKDHKLKRKLSKLCSCYFWIGFILFKAAGTIQQDSSLLNTKSPDVPGTYLIDLGRMKGSRVKHGVT